MATRTENSEGIVLDSALIIRAAKYYAVIGAGLGLLGIIFLSQFLGGSDGGGSILGGIFIVIVLAFALLCGPVIAAIIGFATSAQEGSLKHRAINSGIANGIGFAVFGFVVFLLLVIGLTLFIGSGGGGAEAGAGGGGGGDGGTQTPMQFFNFLSILVLMVIPNALVGGGITFFLGDGPREQTRQTTNH